MSSIPSSRPAAPGPLGRAFNVHLGAVGMANLADGVVQTGLGLVALSFTRDPVVLGALTAATWMPWLLLGLPAGSLVDRWPRRTTMTVALAVRVLLLASAAVAAATGRLEVTGLVVLAFGYGVTEVFTDLAAQARVPALVGRNSERLQRANARLISVEQVTNGFVGPPLAGLLMGAGAVWVLGLPAAAVAGGVALLALGWRARSRAHLHGLSMEAAAKAAGPRGGLWDGLAMAWGHPVLRPLLLAGGMWNFGSTAMGAVLLLWMVGPGSAGGLAPQTWGLVATALPAGALLGARLAAPLLRRYSEMRVLAGCWWIGALALVLPLLLPSAAGMVVYGLVAGSAGVVGNVISGSIRPRMIPDHQLGKVGGAARLIGFGAIPLGALAAGYVAAEFGVPSVMVGAAGVAGAATLLVSVTVPQRLVDEYELEQEAE